MRWATALLLIAYLSSVEGLNEGSLVENFTRLIGKNLKRGGSGLSAEQLSDTILFTVIPVLLKQKPLDADGRFEQNREYLFRDTSNDEIAHSSVGAIIKRSGFQVETHEVVSDDGYITMLYHLINPLADRTKLKQPPVMMMHGGTQDPTAYLLASSIQHRPEKYPRVAEDGLMKSWNRSLAFLLANNGYDVWLVATRGCNSENQRKVPTKKAFGGVDLSGGGSSSKNNMSTSDNLIDLETSNQYWHYSFDELIQYEFPRQLDKVLELTGAKNVSLFTYSFSAEITLPALGSRPDIAKNKIHNYIVMAPILNIDSANLFVNVVAEIFRNLPVELGTSIVTRLITSRFTRNLLVDQTKEVRYTLIKFLVAIIFGSSGKYRSVLEPSFLGHVFLPTSFMQAKHACQINHAKRYQKYDYGAITNKLVYGQMQPPAYDVSNIHVKNWLLISGENDNLSPASSVGQILREVNPKPLKHVRVPGASHADLEIAFDNDIQINFPTLQFLDRFAI